MPKFKRASSSQLSSQAKKRKKKTRQDPVKRQQERERDRLRHMDSITRERHAAAHRQVRLTRERRQMEQERDTEAHQRVRQQNRERRLMEQERDTEAHRRVRIDNPHRRTEEQVRNTAAHQVSRENPDLRRAEQQRDLLQHRVARSDPQYRAQEQQNNNTRRQQVRDGRQASFRALNYNANDFCNTTNVGTLSLECSNCGAIKFPMETESLCCSKGNVQLDAFPQPPVFLQHLYEGVDSNGKHFLTNIRKYNCAFQMTSFGCSEITMAGFNPTFRIQGQVYHLIGSIIPTEGESPKFAQIYFIDNQDSEVATRCAIVDGLKPNIIRGINQLLHESHHYVEVFKVAKEIFEQEAVPTNVKVVINEAKRPLGEHSRRYNRPLSDEVGVLMPNDATNNRDIVLHYRDGGLKRISELHRSYDPLQYPLLFTNGTDGWHVNLKLRNGRKLTAMVYYCYHIMIRQNVSVLLRAKRLFQQYLVDAYCKIETERLQFLRREQTTLRADCYQDLWDAILDRDGDPNNVGRRIILPSTFTGGPRYMYERQ